jgi:hypothetical protein
MSTTRTFTLAGSLGGLTFSNGTVRRTGATETNATATLAAGSAGTLTTRTDDNTGEVTLSAGHGQTSGTYDVFWSGGCRRGMTGTVTVNALALDLGAGDVLPADETAVVVDKQEVLDFDSLNTSIVLAAVSQQRRASVEFQEEAGTAILSLDLGRAGVDGEPFLWADDTHVANPFGAVISKIAVSNGSSGGTNLIQIAVLRE